MVEKCFNAQLPLALLSFEKGEDGMKLYGLFKTLNEYMSTIQTLEEQSQATEIIRFLVSILDQHMPRWQERKKLLNESKLDYMDSPFEK